MSLKRKLPVALLVTGVIAGGGGAAIAAANGGPTYKPADTQATDHTQATHIQGAPDVQPKAGMPDGITAVISPDGSVTPLNGH